MWLGSAVMPQASCIASFMQQRVNRLHLQDIIDANARLKELHEKDASIRFNVPVPNTSPEIGLCSFSDAAFNISSSESYGQTGMVIRLLFNKNGG